MIVSPNFASMPGISAAVETMVRAFTFGKFEQQVIVPGIIDGAARDAGATPTTLLRAGLLLGKVTASGKLKQYSPSATDGTEVVDSILLQTLRATDLLTGDNQDKFYAVLAAGNVQAARLIGLDAMARSQMHGRFLFDDDLPGNATYPWKKVTEVSGNTTVTAAMNGTLFVVTGGTGVTFTLPTKAVGLCFGFLNQMDQDMTVASAGSADDIVTFNDAGADSIAFSTGGNKIGAHVRLFCNPDADKWFMELLCKNTLTVA